MDPVLRTNIGLDACLHKSVTMCHAIGGNCCCIVLSQTMLDDVDKFSTLLFPPPFTATFCRLCAYSLNRLCALAAVGPGKI